MASVLLGVVQLMNLTAATVAVAVVAEGQLLAEVVAILLVQPVLVPFSLFEKALAVALAILLREFLGSPDACLPFFYLQLEFYILEELI